MGKVTIDSNHIYRVDGVIKPGFTEIKESFGIGDNAFYTEEGREEGTAIHEWMLFLAAGKKSKHIPEASISGRVEGIRKFLRETRFEFVGGETPLHCATSDYCCTPDLWGRVDGVPSVVEAKRGAKETWHKLQTAAQKIALRENGYPVINRIGLYLKDDGTYRLDPHTDTRNEHEWRALVSAFHVKGNYQKRGKTK